MKFLLLLLIAVSCAPTIPVSPEQVALWSRISHASTHYPCTPNATTSEACLDDQGLVWSTCAWNTCGISEGCRREHQHVVAAGSCGGPDWPPCSAGR